MIWLAVSSPSLQDQERGAEVPVHRCGPPSEKITPEEKGRGEREGRREGRKEGGKEGGREGRREGEREGGREGGREWDQHS